MLILFDIDGTLLLTRGAGIKALTTALQEAYENDAITADGVDTAGGLDPLIVNDVLAANDIEPDPRVQVMECSPKGRESLDAKGHRYVHPQQSTCCTTARTEFRLCLFKTGQQFTAAGVEHGPLLRER